MLTKELLLKRFRYFLIEKGHSISLARKKAGFRSLTFCKVSKEAASSAEFIKIKLEHMNKSHPTKKGMINNLKEEYENRCSN